MNDNGKSQWLEEHLRIIKEKINNEANAIAKNDNRPNIEPRDVAAAAMLYAPGTHFPEIKSQMGEMDLPFWRRMALSITGVTLMAGLLAIVFGIIGGLAAAGKLGSGQQYAAGAFDIAKIFAGAVVGSTGATVAQTRKRD